jgi:hypothetical protein
MTHSMAAAAVAIAAAADVTGRAVVILQQLLLWAQCSAQAGPLAQTVQLYACFITRLQSMYVIAE